MRGFVGAVLVGGPMDGVIVRPGAPALHPDWWRTWPAGRRSLTDRLLRRHPRLGRYRGWAPGRYVVIPEARHLTYGWQPYDLPPSRGPAIVPWLLLLAAVYTVLTRDALGPLLAFNIGDVFLRVLANMDDFEKDVVKKGSGAADKAGNTLGGQMSKGLSRGITAVSAAGGVMLAGAIESGAKFEDQLRTINTVAGLSDQELGAVGDSLQGLSRETGKTTDDLTAGFYDLVSAGVPASEAINVLRDSAKFATGALGTTQESVDLVTSAMNAYGLEAGDSTRITDIFAKAVADGKVTAAELGNSLAQVAPIAASAGISLEEVSAGYAQLTAKGVPAAQAATQMRAAISALLTPNGELNKLQKQTGINFAELAKEKGLAVALDEIRKATNGNNDSFARALGSTEAYQFALASTGENAEAFAAQIVETGEASGLAAAQYEEASKSAVQQGARWAATLNTLAQDFGGAFAGAAPFLTTINQLGPAFGGLITPAKAFGGVLGGVFGKLAPKLLGPLSKLGGKLGLTLATSIGAGIASSAAENVIGDAVGDSVGSALGGAGIKAKLKGPLGALGKFMGSGLGTATVLGFAAVAVAGVIETYNQVANQTKAQNAQISKDVANQIATGTTAQLEQSKAALESGISKLNGVWDAGLFTNESRAKLQADLDAVNAALTTGAGRMPQAVSTELEQGRSEVDIAAQHMMGGVEEEVGAAATAAGETGESIPENIGAGILEQQGQVDAAMAELTNLIENERTPAQQAAHVIGQLISPAVSNGIKSKREGVKNAALSLRETGEAELRKFISEGGKIGKKAMDALRDGAKSKDPDIRRQSKRTLAIIKEETDKLKGIGKKGGQDLGDGAKQGIDSKKGAVRGAAAGYRNAVRAQLPSSNEGQRWGSGLGQAYAQGIRSSKKWITQAARNAAAAAAAIFATHSPPGPESPLHNIVKWANETMQLYAGGLEAEAPGVGRAAGTAASEAARALAGTLAGPRIGPPAIAQARGLAVATAARGSMPPAGNHYTYNMPVQGALPVRTPADTIAAMRRINEIGELPPKLLTPQYPRREAERRP